MLSKKFSGALLSLALTLGASSSAFAAATIVIFNNDPAGVGFNDATAALPVGGNTGTTLGQQRLIAFQAAANKWGATLDSTVTITVRAQWTALTCSATSAVLGSAGAVSVRRDFVGAPFAGTWYGASLGNKLAGSDSDAVNPEINANFNVNLGNAGCLTGTFFYLGLDNNHGANIDLVTVLTHEFGHGLGFQTFTSGTTGVQNSGFPTIYDRFLIDLSSGKSWLQMTDAERVASAINARKLAWDGPQVLADAPGVLSLGTALMKINAPVGIAGIYDVGTASFGAALTAVGVTGNVLLANDSVGTVTDGCEVFAPGFFAGKIALIDRGTCGFAIKVKNAQDAGAIAAIIADNVAGSPPPGLGGTDPTVTISSVRITLADGNSIKTQLLSGVVNVTLQVDPTIRAGADAFGKVLMNTPNPFQGGSSVSHWDTGTLPNQLMEPSISTDLTHEITAPNDLTFAQMRDIGWVAQVLPNVIAKTTGDNQSTGVNQPFATPISVTATPAASGLAVTWTVNPSGGGVGATFASTSSRFAVSTTNALGVATAPALTANGQVGTYSMNATIPGAGTTTFSLTNDPPADLVIAKTHSGDFSQGQVGATYSVTVTNAGAGGKPAAVLVTVTDTVPSGLTILAMSGTGWTCVTLPTCTRSDALAASASYPPITVVVAVAGNAITPLVNAVDVTTAATESNSGNNTATDSTNIIAGIAGSLAVSKFGTGTGTVASLDGGINCGATCTQTYVNGSTILLTATASGGSVFTGWLGACTGAAATCTVSISGAALVQATFALTPLGPRILDIDANNAYAAATDGVLVVRHLFGLTGSALTSNALGSGFDPVRVADPALRNYLNDILPYLDVDGNGQVSAVTDGLMIVRKLLGLNGTAITQSAIGTGATRTPAEIDAYIMTLRP